MACGNVSLVGTGKKSVHLWTWQEVGCVTMLTVVGFVGPPVEDVPWRHRGAAGGTQSPRERLGALPGAPWSPSPDEVWMPCPWVGWGAGRSALGRVVYKRPLTVPTLSEVSLVPDLLQRANMFSKPLILGLCRTCVGPWHPDLVTLG